MKREALINLICYILAGVLFLTSVLIICLNPKKIEKTPEGQLSNEKNVSEINNGNNGENFPPNENHISEKENNFPINLLAPFVDMVSWVNDSTYGINGVPNLQQFYWDCGCKYYNLGFIRADDTKPLENDGTIRWGWGGYYKLSPSGNDGFQYEGILESIKRLRASGGDVIVSFGGQLGTSPWTTTQNVDKLSKMYIDVVNEYDLKRIDLDIEESNQDYNNNLANARAVKIAQDKTGVEVTLTIPIMPYGWDTKQLNIIRAYLTAGVDIKLINSMTMCYGYNAVGVNESFGDASIRALKNANKQLIQLYSEYGINLSESEAYKLMGATVDIGYENTANPIFTTEETKQVAEFARDKEMGMYSFWCMNRDSLLEYNKAINYTYTYYLASSYYFEK
jgi:chitinase